MPKGTFNKEGNGTVMGAELRIVLSTLSDHFGGPCGSPPVPVGPPHVAPVAPLVHPGGGVEAGDYIRPAAVAPLEHPGGAGGDAAVYLEDHAYAAALALWFLRLPLL
ncbi:hypothetical protein WMY93_024361 [Mugilogobius chulae]|uniref:Uncharacterized protein n=1 Tax=Mugilogobius chulae TaxID=88201 RepID=A0AAW0NC04_9GOBI